MNKTTATNINKNIILSATTHDYTNKTKNNSTTNMKEKGIGKIMVHKTFNNKSCCEVGKVKESKKTPTTSKNNNIS